MQKKTPTKPVVTPAVKGQVNIESLLAKREQISNKAVQAALAKLEQKKIEEQEEMILTHLSTIQENTANAVARLREARKTEVKCKNYLQEIANAEQQFYVDANMETYNASLKAAEVAFYCN